MSPTPLTTATSAEESTSVGANDAASTTLNIFISYSQADSNFMRALRKHLSPLEQANMVRVWADDCIAVSEEWSKAIDDAIQNANVALLLLSADFFASEFIQQRELPALQARATQGLKLIPVIIRDIDWYSSALSKFQAPLQAQPVSSPQNDSAWVKVASEIRYLCEAERRGTTHAQATFSDGSMTASVPIVSRPPPPLLVPSSVAGLPSGPNRKPRNRPRPGLTLSQMVVGVVGVVCALGTWSATWPELTPTDPALRAGLEDVSRALDLGDWLQAQTIVTSLEKGLHARPELILGRQVADLYRGDSQKQAQPFYDEVDRLLQQSNKQAGLFAGHLHVARANRLFYEMHWEAARTAYRRALAARPRLVAALMGLGMIDLWQDEPRKALKSLSRAEALAAHSPQVQVALGAAQLRLRNTAQALTHYRIAVRREPGYIAAHLELARAERDSGHPQKALGVLRLIDERWSDYVAQPRNRSPLGYRLGTKVARMADLDDPPILFIRGEAQLTYFFWLSMALSACLSGDELEQTSSLRQASQLIGHDLTPDSALRGRLILLDELNETNRACLFALEQAQSAPLQRDAVHTTKVTAPTASK